LTGGSGLAHLGRSHPARNFLKLFSELQALATSALVTTVEEENSKLDFLKDIRIKEEKAFSEAQKLSVQLQELRAKLEREANHRALIINKYKEELNELRSTAVAEQQQTQAEMTSMSQKEATQHTEKITTLGDSQKKLSSGITELVSNNKKAEQNARKKKAKTEKEVANWVHKYDMDMTEKANEIKILEEEDRIIVKELADLEVQYQALMKEKEEILSKEKGERETKEKELERARHVYFCALRIQRSWRRYWKKVQSTKKASKVLYFL
jgi:hypothetical protein